MLGAMYQPGEFGVMLILVHQAWRYLPASRTVGIEPDDAEPRQLANLQGDQVVLGMNRDETKTLLCVRTEIRKLADVDETVAIIVDARFDDIPNEVSLLAANPWNGRPSEARSPPLRLCRSYKRFHDSAFGQSEHVHELALAEQLPERVA